MIGFLLTLGLLLYGLLILALTRGPVAECHTKKG